jgi:hypothetical protein
MRLCTIIFPETSSSRIKEYTFKIPNMPYVEEGDILRNPHYQNAPMKVIRVFDYPVRAYNVYNGHLLKELLPDDTQIDRLLKINNNKTSNMEKRNITVSLEEAREWYNGENQILRKLALQAYTEKELSEPQTFRDVLKALGIQSLNIGMKVNGKEVSSVEIGNELATHIRLMFIAKYFNGTWKPEINKTKYFLARTDLPYSIELDNNFCIGTHERVMYPGIVYFQKQEYVKKAYEMLKDELK